MAVFVAALWAEREWERGVPDRDWLGDVSVFVFAVDEFDQLDQKGRRDVRQFVDRIIDEAKTQRQVCIKYRSWNSACILLLAGDIRKPVRFLEELSFRLAAENGDRKHPVRLRCAMHCGDVLVEGDRDRLVAEGDAIQLGKLLLATARAEQIVSSGAYKNRVTAFGTVPADLFVRLPDITDGKRKRHEVWNVRQRPGYGIDPAPAPDRPDRETELRHVVETSYPKLRGSVSSARERRGGPFQLLDRVLSSFKLLGRTLATRSDQYHRRVTRLQLQLVNDIEELRAVEMYGLLEAVPIEEIVNDLGRLVLYETEERRQQEVIERSDIEQTGIANDLSQGGELRHWPQRQRILDELVEVERSLDRSVEGLTRGEQEVIRMELDELRIVLDLDPLPLQEIDETSKRLRGFQVDLLRRLQNAIQLLLSVYADQLPVSAVFRDVERGPELVVAPVGSFLMGSPEGEEWRFDVEGPQHEVRITRRFALGRYPVTFEEYDRFTEAMGHERASDESWGRGRRPVVNVSWEDARAYVAWLCRETGKPYRLPSEAEWEYACRAGTTTRYSWGNEITPENANYDWNVGKTTEVGAYPANAWGFYDMHGNVWEWCEDVWHKSYDEAPGDGTAWIEGGEQSRRVLRGGSWFNVPEDLRSAGRSRGTADDRSGFGGFRVARTLR